MLRFFRLNDPYRLLAILVLMILFALPLLLDLPTVSVQELRYLVVGESVSAGQLMYIQIYDATAPFAAALFGLMDWLFGRSLLAREIVTLAILFFQAAFFAVLLINNKAYNDNSYVPALIFSLICFVSYDFLSLSPELFGSTLLLLALNNLFKEIEFRIQREETILSLGVYLGAASIFVFSYSIFLIGSLLILILFTRISIRKALLLIFGFGLPHIILFLVYLRWSETELLWQNFYAPNLSWGQSKLITWTSLLYLFAIPAAYFLISLFMLTREARFTKYQSQLFQVMFLWLFLSFVEILLTKERTPHSFITIIPSLTYFVSHYLLLIRRKWIAEMMLWLFMAGLLTIANLARTNRLTSIDYSTLRLSTGGDEVTGKKVMVLGPHDGSMYIQNQLGGYFLDWNLSKTTFDHLDEYEAVAKINEAFEKNPPDVIVDPENRMPSVLFRIPALEKKYRKDGSRYWRLP